MTDDLQVVFSILEHLGAVEVMNAMRIRSGLRRDVARVLREVDVLALPTTVTTAPSVTDEQLNACPQTATCVQGSCQCPNGQTKCGNTCVDTKTDNSNCGSCNATCGGPDAGMIMGGGMWACTNGSCTVVCTQPKTNCSDSCVDTKTDHDNCGMCGNGCMMTEDCTESMCCPMGNKVCNAMCTDTTSDAKNCGMCGNACPMNTPSCVNSMCSASFFVEIFPPSGVLQDPGAATYWSARYYTMTFAQPRSLISIDVRANLAVNDTIRGEVWNPQNQQKLATGSAVNGSGSAQFYRSNIAFNFQANTAYIVGVYFSNSNTVFPRKDGPSYPFTTNGVTVSACWSTNTTNTDIFPSSGNSWAPDFKLQLQ
jgi:hypothetical protein